MECACGCRCHTRRGELILYIGCMFSEKTRSMTTAINRHVIAKKRAVILRPECDSRYPEETEGLKLNNGEVYRGCRVVKLAKLEQFTNRIDEFDVIGVNETQFFPDPEILDEWANQGKIVICDSLNGNFNRELFGESYKLFSKAEEIHKLFAVCIKCGNKASFTKRYDTTEIREVVIGGINEYYPVCRNCYNL